jgi:hypothetical protein
MSEVVVVKAAWCRRLAALEREGGGGGVCAALPRPRPRSGTAARGQHLCRSAARSVMPGGVHHPSWGPLEPTQLSLGWPVCVSESWCGVCVFVCWV